MPKAVDASSRLQRTIPSLKIVQKFGKVQAHLSTCWVVREVDRDRSESGAAGESIPECSYLSDYTCTEQCLSGAVRPGHNLTDKVKSDPNQTDEPQLDSTEARSRRRSVNSGTFKLRRASPSLRHLHKPRFLTLYRHHPPCPPPLHLLPHPVYNGDIDNDLNNDLDNGGNGGSHSFNESDRDHRSSKGEIMLLEEQSLQGDIHILKVAGKEEVGKGASYLAGAVCRGRQMHILLFLALSVGLFVYT
ncbi:hypothetical protein BKA70DRAFT_1227587 [Coprinopsis sp. MPI-PUGE-AT-0042]|nr:hypothetical protein BKA70DRAFT_1227587 [Coprinopsis sp. MPI-PUGE-AT-0042]